MAGRRLLERLGIIRKVQLKTIKKAAPQYVDVSSLYVTEESPENTGEMRKNVFIADPKTEKRVSFFMSPKVSQDTQLELVEKLKEAALSEAGENIKYVPIDELYAKLGHKPNGAGTIFIVDSFAQALPEATTEEKRRAIVQQVMLASGTSLESLVNDGTERIEALDGYLQRLHGRIEALRDTEELEVERLADEIAKKREEIAERDIVSQRQERAIDEEIRRIRKIVDFIKDG
jgi:hypothetical protein